MKLKLIFLFISATAAFFSAVLLSFIQEINYLEFIGISSNVRTPPWIFGILMWPSFYFSLTKIWKDGRARSGD